MSVADLVPGSRFTRADMSSIYAGNAVAHYTIDYDGLRHTGATNPIVTLEQSDLLSGALQIISRNQVVDPCTDDSDVLWGFCH